MVAMWEKIGKGAKGGVLAIGVFKGEPPPGKLLTDRSMKALTARMEQMHFTGKAGQTCALDITQRRCDRVVVIGLGERDKQNLRTMREFGAAAVKAAMDINAPWLAMAAGFDNSTTQQIEHMLIGAQIGAWRFYTPEGDRETAPRLEGICVLDARVTPHLLRRVKVLAGNYNGARNHGMLPQDVMTPETFQREAEAFVESHPQARCRVIRGRDLARYGGISAVGQGTKDPTCKPRFVVLTWSPKNAATNKCIAVVGKGMCYDTGGISLKAAKGGGLEEMHLDMMGAATAFAFFRAVVELGFPVAVKVVLCLAVNDIGPDSYRPSDVVTLASGTTVEIHNTDAEGRLVVADGIAAAFDTVEEGDTPITDLVTVATLTGAAMVALGTRTSAVFVRDGGEQLWRLLEAAGMRTGELLWQLPIPPDVVKALGDTERADMKNVTGSPYGGAAAGAAVIFAGLPKGPKAQAVRVVHVDMAGPGVTHRRPHPLFSLVDVAWELSRSTDPRS